MRFLYKVPIFENLTLALNVAIQIINLSPNHKGFLLDESKFEGIRKIASRISINLVFKLGKFFPVLGPVERGGNL